MKLTIKSGSILGRDELERLAKFLAGEPMQNPIVGRVHYHGGQEHVRVSCEGQYVVFDAAPKKEDTSGPL